MKRGILISVGLLVTMFPLLGFTMTTSRQYEVPESEKSVNALLGRIAEALAKKHHMRMCGISVAMPDGDVMGLGPRFDIYGPLNKAEIRTLLVDCVQTFLVYVNADERVRPHLNHYPFEVKDIDIGIFIKGRHAELLDPNIRIASIRDGRLNYLILQKEDCVLLKKTIKISTIKNKEVESYAEAVEAMKHEQESTAQ